MLYLILIPFLSKEGRIRFDDPLLSALYAARSTWRFLFLHGAPPQVEDVFGFGQQRDEAKGRSIATAHFLHKSSRIMDFVGTHHRASVTSEPPAIVRAASPSLAAAPHQFGVYRAFIAYQLRLVTSTSSCERCYRSVVEACDVVVTLCATKIDDRIAGILGGGVGS